MSTTANEFFAISRKNRSVEKWRKSRTVTDVRLVGTMIYTAGVIEINLDYQRAARF
jgi:hypothetical protein